MLYFDNNSLDHWGKGEWAGGFWHSPFYSSFIVHLQQILLFITMQAHISWFHLVHDLA